MRQYHNLENTKLMLKFEKPRLLHILPNNKFHYKINPINSQNKYTRNTSLSPLIIRNNKISNNNNNLKQYINFKNNQSPVKTYNYMKDTFSNMIRTTPMKYQYKKIPFDKVKGFKLKLPTTIINNNQNNNNNLDSKKNILNAQQSYYPVIREYNNHSTIQNNININPKKDKPNQSSFSILNYNYYNSYKKNNNNTNNNTINTILTTNTNSNNNTLNIIHEKCNTTNNTHNKSKSHKKKIIIFSENKISLPQFIETKSSSNGSKMETREGSSHYLNKSRSKSSISSLQLFKNKINLGKNESKGLKNNNFSFLKFDKNNYNQNNKLKLNISSKKKILKYLDKTIKQLTKIKTIILDEKDSEDYKEEDINEENEIEEIQKEGKNKYNKIEFSKIKQNLDKYKNINGIDKNTINISTEGNSNNMRNNNNNNGHVIKKLNRTITYDNLKCNIKENQKLLNITQKSFKNFKKLYENKRNKSEKFNNKYETIGSYYGDSYNYKGFLKKNDYKINNYDTEIFIPKLKINYNKNNINSEIELNKIKEEEYLNNIDDGYNINNKKDNIPDLTNFEFSD